MLLSNWLMGWEFRTARPRRCDRRVPRCDMNAAAELLEDRTLLAAPLTLPRSEFRSIRRHPAACQLLTMLT